MMITYMSFCDPDRPKGQQWLGGCYVEGDADGLAMTNSHLLGCNPGGEVMMLSVPDHVRIDPAFMNRLLTTPDDVEAATLP